MSYDFFFSLLITCRHPHHVIKSLIIIVAFIWTDSPALMDFSFILEVDPRI